MKDEVQILSDFLAKRKILIADVNTASRVGLARSFVEMGANMSYMTLVDSFEWAEEIIARDKPSVLVCDYQIGTRCGLDLLTSDARGPQDPSDSLSLIITKNTSQAAVARAAQGDVDVYITKPYNLDILKKSMATAVMSKIQPNPYLKTVYEGRKLLVQNELDKAMDIFQKATSLDSKPALAYFYHGHCHTLNDALTDAQASFLKGLECNQIHYKCMTGLYDTLMAQGNDREAYQIIKRILETFPLSASRLYAALRLAVKTTNFRDIVLFYDIFLELEERGEDLIKAMCAGLVVAGKYCLLRNTKPEALDYFQKAAVSCGGRISFLGEMITTLVAHQMSEEADKFLGRVPPDQRDTLEYHVLNYLILSKLKPVHVGIQHGRRLIQAGKYHPTIHKVLIEVAIQANLKDFAESMIHDARNRWPDLAAEFDPAILELRARGANTSGQKN